MKALKNVALIILLLTFGMSCQHKEVKAPSTASITGKLDVGMNDTILVYSDDMKHNLFDSIFVENGNFAKTINVDGELMAYLSIENREYPLFLHPGDTLKVIKKDSILYDVIGNAEHAMYNELMTKYAASNDSLHIITDYIETNPFSLHAYYLFNQFHIDNPDVPIGDVRDVIEALPGVVQDKYYLEELLVKVNKASKAKIGNSALYFNLKKVKDNKSVDLQQIKNKIVLMYFWTSWNEQTKDDNTVLNRIYKKYNPNKDFKMLSVALENDTTALKSYIKVNKLNWEHLYDTSGLEATVADRYGVIELPTYFLMNKKNEIVWRSTSVESLENKLVQLYKEDKVKK